ncbi:glycerate kinase type-2 family protein [Chitinophaga tropicalis]|uniref:DUF4147 domain-containing protein n=1 Tax=Chitinophaga tropicalis TaxID=2683588 RepID=A0A7K1UAN8_9BACT|nr:glycerate kinase [Chitinophaga tropicalis]MVT11085.1 DUF4147 domain-containing protein [Chitinophaga tropicalis]
MMRADAIEIFGAGVASVQPSALMRQHVQWQNGQLQVCGRVYPLPAGRPVWIFGAGKASAAMAQSLEDVLEGLPLKGMVITKHAHGLPLKHILLEEAGHPVPDQSSVQATQKMLQLLNEVREHDVVLFLLSGGASSLMADYPKGADLQQVQQVFGLLLKSGATIHEMNIVRKHLSAVKGGQLALRANTSAFCSLILSDVVGDDLPVIGSGPTVPDPSTFKEAYNILEQYGLSLKIPPAIRKHLLQGCAGTIPETPKPGHPRFETVSNHLTGSNRIALEAAARKARELGYDTRILSDGITGDAVQLARRLVQEAAQQETGKAVCLLTGGETTVTVTGNGLGGRNQHLALAAGIALEGRGNILLLSAGTDGTDGPTDAAGALADAGIMAKAAQEGLDAEHYLLEHDSYHFFEQAGGLLKTGPTQTNVMDIIVVLTSPAEKK